MPSYATLLSQISFDRATAYLGQLRSGDQPGAFLREQLASADLSALTEEQFLEHLVRTKRPQIFAESAVAGDGSDWTLTELGLLGDISMAAPVTFLTTAVTPTQRFTRHLSPVGCCLRPGRCCGTAVHTPLPIGMKS